ncbi:hypothetical protein KKD91_02780 [Patescibacteria group bacterium]|nr:hypothetical protein [Patescibacteria group bacterium]
MKKIIFLIIVCFLFLPVVVKADSLGEKRSFYVDSDYDLNKRGSINAVLLKITPRVYFYVDENWWNFTPQNEIYAALSSLGDEFDNKIYPVLTSNFGSEWTPGIDKDAKITVLIHPMIEGVGGYFRSNDEYTKLQVPGSNEKEMVYLSVTSIKNSDARSFLAHEFTHLITFNQKNKTHGIEEETWLNEMRAEYASTLLGYDDVFTGSYLQNRVQVFSDNPIDSITEWNNVKEDYGAINLFAQYLVDYYGKEILIDSLHSSKIGIDSINYALQKNGINKDFSQIFTNWTIAIFINDCNFGQNYCYLNKNLKNLHVYPRINFLPLSGQSILSVTETTKDWAGNWFKIIGGRGNIKVSFISNGGNSFTIPYIIQKNNGSCVIKFLDLVQSKGEINIQNFGSESVALTLIPSTQIKLSGFDDNELSRSFTFTVSASGQQIIPDGNSLIPASFTFQKNLYFGMLNQDVVYLKIMLAAEGCVSGLANTTYFGPKTLEAVKCFQNKYKSEISAAAGYTIKGTGFVGIGTRDRLNILLGE